MKWLVVALVCFAPLVSAKEKEKPKKHEKERERPAGPVSLELESVDLAAARVWVRVGGAPKAPDGRLFVFHDDRERHFVALYSRCEPAPSRKVDVEGEQPRSDVSELRCELEMPRSYVRANVQSLTVRLRGKEVFADAQEVQSRFAAAREKAGIVALAPAAPKAPTVAAGESPAAVAAPAPAIVIDDPGFVPAEEIYPLPKKAPPPAVAPPPPADGEEDEDGEADE